MLSGKEPEPVSFSDDEFEVRFHRGTGKGGQRKNKVATCCIIRHLPTGLTQKADGRSRIDNENEAMARLITILNESHANLSNSLVNNARRDQIGSGNRADIKKRTYRFQDDLVIDHQTGKSVSCKIFMRGGIENIW